jgi:hypothetical protein
LLLALGRDKVQMVLVHQEMPVDVRQRRSNFVRARWQRYSALGEGGNARPKTEKQPGESQKYHLLRLNTAPVREQPYELHSN